MRKRKVGYKIKSVAYNVIENNGNRQAIARIATEITLQAEHSLSSNLVLKSVQSKSGVMSASSAFSDDKGGSSNVGEPEYGHDPASGGIFSSDYKR